MNSNYATYFPLSKVKNIFSLLFVINTLSFYYNVMNTR